MMKGSERKCGRMRKILIWLLCAGLLAGCTGSGNRQTVFQATYLDVFDTVTVISGRADSRAEFTAAAEEIHGNLMELHRLFDIYQDYEGLSNLKTVNDNAGIKPVAVDERILTLLSDCKAYDALTGHRVNAAMGSVLALWHDAREAARTDPAQAALPDDAALKEAARHRDWAQVILDEEAGTVFLADPEMRLDVGAVAKGWATEAAAQSAPEGFLLSVGGNVRATGAKDGKGTGWVVGVANPDGGDYLRKVAVTSESVVTSGDYQRYFTVDGVRYCHIIDPDTLYPGTRWRAVTVVCRDSGLADALSTGLFLLSREEGEALLTRCGGEALWVAPDGEIYTTPGFDAYIVN